MYVAAAMIKRLVAYCTEWVEKDFQPKATNYSTKLIFQTSQEEIGFNNKQINKQAIKF